MTLVLCMKGFYWHTALSLLQLFSLFQWTNFPGPDLCTHIFMYNKVVEQFGLQGHVCLQDIVSLQEHVYLLGRFEK